MNILRGIGQSAFMETAQHIYHWCRRLQHQAFFCVHHRASMFQGKTRCPQCEETVVGVWVSVCCQHCKRRLPVSVTAQLKLRQQLQHWLLAEAQTGAPIVTTVPCEGCQLEHQQAFSQQMMLLAQPELYQMTYGFPLVVSEHRFLAYAQQQHHQRAASPQVTIEASPTPPGTPSSASPPSSRYPLLSGC